MCHLGLSILEDLGPFLPFFLRYGRNAPIIPSFLIIKWWWMMNRSLMGCVFPPSLSRQRIFAPLGWILRSQEFVPTFMCTRLARVVIAPHLPLLTPTALFDIIPGPAG